MRTCVGCRRTASTSELVRITRLADGTLVVSGSAPGRGAWLCRGRSECFDRAIGRRSFERALRADIDPNQLESVRNTVESATGPASGQGSEALAP